MPAVLMPREPGVDQLWLSEGVTTDLRLLEDRVRMLHERTQNALDMLVRAIESVRDRRTIRRAWLRLGS